MTRRPQVSATALLAVLAVLGIPSSHATAEQASQPAATKAGEIDAGKYHSCAVLPTAALRCWGYGGDGALGYGSTASIGDDEVPAGAGPVDLGAGRSVRAVATGAIHTCVLLDDGSVRCFGFGGDGRLGYGSTDSIGDDESPASAGPVDLGAGRTATAITAGRGHTCALLDDGRVRCWGYGLDGRLGYGSGDSIGDDETPGSVPPVTLPEGHTVVKAISAGDSTTCAILEDGSLSCWGYGQNGQLGYGSTTTIGNDETLLKIAPVQIGAGRTAVAVASGDFHTCVLRDDATVKCWGYGGNGRLGYSSTANVGDRQTPASVGAVSLGEGRTARSITAGTAHTCALLDDGSVRCWGNAVNGQLGYGNRIAIGDNEAPGSVGPVDLGTGRTAVAISAGGDHTCATLDDGSTRCWGDGSTGELGLCHQRSIGDDETPASVGLPDLGVPGIAGTVCSPPPPPPPAPAPSVSATVTEPAGTATDALDAALRLQSERGRGYRTCRSGVTRQARVERAAARRRFSRPARRTLELRTIARRANERRNGCRTTFRRTPGRVTSLTARAASSGVILLRFRAAGSDGSKLPAARGYLVKQSPRPIRTSADFERAPALCEGTCFVDVLGVRADIRLRVNDLKRRTTYYYAIAARDNVTAHTGPRSTTVRATTR